MSEEFSLAVSKEVLGEGDPAGADALVQMRPKVFSWYPDENGWSFPVR